MSYHNDRDDLLLFGLLGLWMLSEADEEGRAKELEENEETEMLEREKEKGTREQDLKDSEDEEIGRASCRERVLRLV